MNNKDTSPIKLTVFHCINSFGNDMPLNAIEDVNLQFVKMSCSSMVKDVFLLRAFESGADGVLVLVCPEQACRHIEGSKRAKKRVERVKKILNEIKINSERLSIFNVSPNNKNDILKIIQEAVINIKDLVILKN
ncbi:MAG: hydrogenase iron-sulfur subunit [Desulfobacterales bacterium]|nr:hydrogenase iron-sulfur subunit [Desulfobacterales bacterium]